MKMPTLLEKREAAGDRYRMAAIERRAAFVETRINAGAAGLAYANLGAINADLAHAANSSAIVYNDATPANNGLYNKSGASGADGWTRYGDLPNSVISPDHHGRHWQRHHR